MNAIEINDDNFNSIVLPSQASILIFFTAPWSGPCRMVGPVIKELAQASDGSYSVGIVNTDESPATAAQYGVRNVPTVVIFKHGEVTGKIVGVNPKSAYENAINAIRN
ncbi:MULTISPECIES: thioredoxin family protein [Pseudomonas]|uniref:Thioredoxin n=2 Tax=Pseudomonas TaxID=286 RepID=A0A0D0THW8_PSEFL|nr:MULTISPECIES: thioredoxin domain-containing protein [Pseudomonas fluorescens group]AZE61419.1 Thioredoxin [Pseudomonas synxantha]KIR22986.1 Thioredoxin-1 [Pseudomonas fluorescens]